MYKLLLLGLLAAAPSSSNFTLDAYDFGNGASASSSSNYQLKGSAEPIADSVSSSSYSLPVGIRASTTIDTPPAPTFTNPDSSYNRLKLTLNVTGIPSDTKYLIAISDDNFTTTNYVQLDQTVGPGVSVSNYQTYAAWGGASGVWILGLSNNTTYKVKVAALQGSATGSKFGPTATAATVAPSLTFTVVTSLTSTPPFSATFTSLPAGSVVAANATITTTITTNASSGGSLLIGSQNAGLNSASKSYTISSTTADLAVAGSGYGAQVTSASQSSGGPIAAVSPFNGTSDNVGGLTSSKQQLASFANPITAGSVTTTLKAKTNASVPAASDYADILTIVLSLLF